jgi:predicted outer membrane protein
MTGRRSLRIGLALLAGGLALRSTAQQLDPSVAPRGLALSALTLGDQQFLQTVMSLSLAEIEAARLALQHAQGAGLRVHARERLQFHERLESQVREVARRNRVALPPAPGDAAHDQLQGLSELRGEAFDRVYLQRFALQRTGETARLLETQYPQLRDAEVSSLAGRLLPVLRLQVDEARRLTP